MWSFVRNASMKVPYSSLHCRKMNRCPQPSILSFRCFSSWEGEFLTGSVKFYIRNKAYGFIIPDDPDRAGTEEVWVHRTSFDTPHSTDEFPTRPYLYKQERVKFRLEDPEGDRTKKAIDLTFANGKIVPLFRKNYHASAIKGENQRLGEFLLEVMREGSTTDEEKMEKIRLAVAATEEVIASAERNQQLYGPILTDDDDEE